VMISETHGMAQRGGNVISHLKISRRNQAPGGAETSYTSPLIRPGRADVLLSLHPDGFRAHGYFLKSGGKAFLNDSIPDDGSTVDASRIAAEIGSSISANLVLLGFAVGSGELFCQPDHLEKTLRHLGGKRLEPSLKAFEAGCKEAKER
jgi:indolepyruvate ferredoxin oxidoreductase, beta subunit